MRFPKWRWIILFHGALVRFNFDKFKLEKHRLARLVGLLPVVYWKCHRLVGALIFNFGPAQLLKRIKQILFGKHISGNLIIPQIDKLEKTRAEKSSSPIRS